MLTNTTMSEELDILLSESYMEDWINSDFEMFETDLEDDEEIDVIKSLMSGMRENRKEGLFLIMYSRAESHGKWKLLKYMSRPENYEICCELKIVSHFKTIIKKGNFEIRLLRKALRALSYIAAAAFQPKVPYFLDDVFRDVVQPYLDHPDKFLARYALALFINAYDGIFAYKLFDPFIIQLIEMNAEKFGKFSLIYFNRYKRYLASFPYTLTGYELRFNKKIRLDCHEVKSNEDEPVDADSGDSRGRNRRESDAMSENAFEGTPQEGDVRRGNASNGDDGDGDNNQNRNSHVNDRVNQDGEENEEDEDEEDDDDAPSDVADYRDSNDDLDTDDTDNEGTNRGFDILSEPDMYRLTPDTNYDSDEQNNQDHSDQASDYSFEAEETCDKETERATNTCHVDSEFKREFLDETKDDSNEPGNNTDYIEELVPDSTLEECTFMGSVIEENLKRKVTSYISALLENIQDTFPMWNRPGNEIVLG